MQRRRPQTNGKPFGSGLVGNEWNAKRKAALIIKSSPVDETCQVSVFALILNTGPWWVWATPVGGGAFARDHILLLTLGSSKLLPLRGSIGDSLTRRCTGTPGMRQPFAVSSKTPLTWAASSGYFVALLESRESSRFPHHPSPHCDHLLLCSGTLQFATPLCLTRYIGDCQIETETPTLITTLRVMTYPLHPRVDHLSWIHLPILLFNA